MRWPLLLLATGVAFVLPSCSRSGLVRVYDEVVITPSSVADAFEGSGSAPATTTSTLGLAWRLPVGWRELPAEGLVLARLAFPTVGAAGQQETGELTVVSLSGSGGDLEANVARWLGQLGLAATSGNHQRVLETREQIRSVGGLDVTLLDFRPVVAGPAAQSFLAGIVPMPGRTLFLKVAGSAAGLAQQRDAFVAFCESLQPT